MAAAAMAGSPIEFHAYSDSDHEALSDALSRSQAREFFAEGEMSAEMVIRV